MQRVLVKIDVLRLGRVELDDRLAFIPEQILDEAHFLPGRDARRERNAYVLPFPQAVIEVVGLSAANDPQQAGWSLDLEVAVEGSGWGLAEDVMRAAGALETIGDGVTHGLGIPLGK